MATGEQRNQAGLTKLILLAGYPGSRSWIGSGNWGLRLVLKDSPLGSALSAQLAGTDWDKANAPKITFEILTRVVS